MQSLLFSVGCVTLKRGVIVRFSVTARITDGTGPSACPTLTSDNVNVSPGYVRISTDVWLQFGWVVSRASTHSVRIR